MAKSKKKKSVKPAPAPEPTPAPSSAADTARDFISRLGEGFKSAAQTAGRYAQVGTSTVEIEKLRLELKFAQSKLGEAVLQCWDEAPDIGVTSSDAAVKKVYAEIKTLRRKIRELESRVSTLRGSNP